MMGAGGLKCLMIKLKLYKIAMIFTCIIGQHTITMHGTYACDMRSNSPGLWPKGVWDPKPRCWCFSTYSHDYNGPACGRTASNFAGSKSIKRPRKSSTTYGFVLVLQLVAADTDQPFCTGVMACERFRCTGVGQERFGHFIKVCDFNA